MRASVESVEHPGPMLIPALIGGSRVPAASGRTIEAVDPATGKLLGQFPRCDAVDVDVAANAAHRAAMQWRQVEAQERAELLLQFAAAVERRGPELAHLDTQDNGSPLREMTRDVDIAVRQLRYLAGLALEVKGASLPARTGRLQLTVREPFGVVGRIIAFNHPLMFCATKLAAPLLAGNAVIMKPSEFTSLSALAMAEDLQRIFPPGVVSILTGYGHEVGDALVHHAAVRRLAFIGSGSTGRRIQARAATSSALKTVTLELGGKNPLVVFDDADLDQAVDGAVAGMNLTWQGQSCGSTSRLLVQRGVYEEVVRRVGERFAALRTGSPFDPGNDSGALVNRAHLDKVLSYVEVGHAEGARLVAGGERLDDGVHADGNFVAPTLFADVDPGGRLATEEIFGPVLAATPFDDYEDAIALANGVDYGLTAAVYTQSLRTAMAFCRDVEAGYVWVNESSRHFAGLPYGGYKDSGVGRDEDISEIESYTQVKAMTINFGSWS